MVCTLIIDVQYIGMSHVLGLDLGSLNNMLLTIIKNKFFLVQHSWQVQGQPFITAELPAIIQDTPKCQKCS